MQGKFTNKAQEVLKRAQEAALKLGNKYVGTEHILLGLTLVSDSVAAKALESQGVTYHQVMDKIQSMTGGTSAYYIPADFTPRAKRVVESSVQEAFRMGTGYVGTEHILIALIRENDNIAVRIMVSLDLNLQRLYDDIMNMLGEGEDQNGNARGMNSQGEKQEKSATETLDKFSRDMTALAKKNKFDPIVGRDKEIERIVQI
ncbi:Clp protease N-terminal domain-containing protein, partial [Anaerotignum lactatifermentans]